MRIPGTSPLRGVPHYTNYRRLAGYEKATGVRVAGKHAALMDWLLPAVCPSPCPHCDQLGVRLLGGAWSVCAHCEGSVWTVTPELRARIRAWVGARFPNALI